MAFIRSFIFWILLYISVVVALISFYITSIFSSKKTIADEYAKIWAQTVVLLLKYILNINYKIVGAKNIPSTPCIIACKHESMWETVIFHLICKHPAYIYKKELLKVPFYGWYVKKMSGVKVDRKGAASALKDMIKQSKTMIAENHNIVIFPQGTRTPYGASTIDYPYQVGVAALYATCNVPVVPAALDSGKFWGKNMLIKKSGSITIEFLPPIETGLAKDMFMKELEERIETVSNKL